MLAVRFARFTTFPNHGRRQQSSNRCLPAKQRRIRPDIESRRSSALSCRPANTPFGPVIASPSFLSLDGGHSCKADRANPLEDQRSFLGIPLGVRLLELQ